MKFSIITITHNRAHLIGETIESVINQTYQNFEHIIIDDGSTDNTEEVIKSFKDDRLKYYKYAKHPKRSFLRNEGVRKSKGDIICILDSDDNWKKNKLTILFEIFKNNTKVILVIHNAMKSNGELIYNFKKEFFRNILKDILKNNILPYPFYSFRKSILNKIELYDEDMEDGQHDFFLRFASKYPIFYIPIVLSYKKLHSKNISKNPRVSAFVNFNLTLQKLFEQNKITHKDLKKYTNYNNFKIAVLYNKNNNKLKSAIYLKKVLRQAPILSKIFIKSIILKTSILTK